MKHACCCSKFLPVDFCMLVMEYKCILLSVWVHFSVLSNSFHCLTMYMRAWLVTKFPSGVCGESLLSCLLLPCERLATTVLIEITFNDHLCKFNFVQVWLLQMMQSLFPANKTNNLKIKEKRHAHFNQLMLDSFILHLAFWKCLWFGLESLWSWIYPKKVFRLISNRCINPGQGMALVFSSRYPHHWTEPLG